MLSQPIPQDFWGAPDALGLAALIRTGKLSRREVLEGTIRRIETLDTRLNSVVLRFFDQALATADAPVPAGRFAGIPFLLKDAQTPVAGQLMTQGSRVMAQNRAAASNLLVERLQDAGLTIMGRSSSAEFGAMFETHTPLYGPTRNPWAPDHSSGGSSGGAAASVAARMVPAGHAGDGAGSIRVPAAFCGIFGHKPSRGLIPMGPDPLESPGGTTTSGFVTLSVRDNAALVDAVSAPMTGALYAAFGQGKSLMAALERPVGRLKIAVIRRPLSENAVDPELLAALDDTVALCIALGHEVVEAELPIDHAATLEQIWLHWAVSIGTALHRIDQRRGYPGAVRDAGRFVQHLWEKSRAVTASDYLVNLNRLQTTSAMLARWMEEQGHDCWLSPMTTGLPPAIGWLDAETTDPETVYIRQRDHFSFTPLANHMGTPGISVPLHWSRAGLPIGSQFVDRAGGDALLMQLARQLEEARPWAGIRPPPV